MAPKQARVRCCNKCADRPPLSQCIHTKAGRLFLENLQTTQENGLEVRRTDDVERDMAEESETTQRQDSSPLNPTLERQGSDGLLSQMAPAVPVFTNERSQLSIQHLLEQLMPQRSPTSQSMCRSATPVTPSRSREHPFSPTGIGATPMSSPGPFERTDGLSSSLPPSPLRSSPTFSSLIRKKAKVTKKNPAWGFVGGAMRGSKKLEIIRPQALRNRMEDQAASTKRFHREIGALIARAERLSEETGCWLTVMAQHGNSGSSATHFTSSSLRRDAKEDTVSLINQFHSITRALLVSKRQGALEMAKRLVEAEETAVNAQTTLAAKQVLLTEALELLAQHGIAGPSTLG